MAKSLSVKNNNPGNIVWGDYAAGLGALQGLGGFAKFDSPIQGLSAMLRLLAGSSYRFCTIAEAIARYAPPEENDTESYIAFVCLETGLNRFEKLSHLSPFDIMDVLRAMVEKEGWHEE
jgi:hypothetical protein